MSEKLGHDLWTPCRRFGIKQGTRVDEDGKEVDKIRPIDDLSEFFVNACTTIEDKVPVAGVDAIMNMARFWAEAIMEGRSDAEHRFSLKLQSGETLQGILHEDFRSGPIDMKGKCLDLESAYKQCPLSPTDEHCSICAVENPNTSETEYFLMRVLPFGATAAVHGFNRAATALNKLLHSFAGAPCSDYYDDFCFVALGLWPI